MSDRMERCGSFGIRDVGRAAIFSRSDEGWVPRLARPQHFDTFIEKLDRLLNDQTAYVELENRHLEPLEVAFKDDITTNDGAKVLCQRGVGESVNPFNYMACGTGTTAEAVTNDQLASELARVALNSGSAFSSGMSMKFAGYFNTLTPTGNITEYAPANGPTPGPSNSKILARTVFSPALVHTQNQTFFLLTQVVSITPQ